MARVRRWQSHGNVSDAKEHPARHEATQSRQHHHGLLRRWPPSAPPSAHPVFRRQAGIEILTQVVAAQAGPYNIRVNCIAPETILTERNKQRIPEAQLAALVDLHPIKRLGTPEDVACAALFLASDDAAWITGIVLDVAGGAVMVR